MRGTAQSELISSLYGPKSKRLTRLVALAVRDNHPRNQLLRKYDIPPQSFKRHRRLYEAWLAEKPGRGHKHSAR